MNVSLLRRMPVLRHARHVAWLALAGLACGPILDPSERAGELGNGVFLYDCDSSGRMCEDGHAPQFPTRIAVDTRFSLAYSPFVSSTFALDLEPASQEFLEVRDDGWRARAKGAVAILSRLSGSGDLFDYAYVDLVPAAGVKFYRAPASDRKVQSASVSWEPLNGEASFTLTQGQGLQLVAEPFGSDGISIAGEPLIELACDKDVLALERPATRKERFLLRATGAGEATCTLHALGVTQAFSLKVLANEDPDPEPDAGADPDAGTDPDASDAEVQP